MAKVCKECLRLKSASEFYKHPGMADGRLNVCKECHKAAVIKNRVANIERYRDYDRGRAMLAHRVAAREEYAASEAGKAVANAAKNRWRLRHLLERSAHRAVQYALSIGALKKGPCEKCGAAGRTEAHHDDYSKPLDVRWLCSKHHRELHKLARAQARREGK